MIGKSKLVLTHQKDWIISFKDLKVAKLLSKVMLRTFWALSLLNCTLHIWTDLRVILKLIVNPEKYLLNVDLLMSS